jgi:hypothetical protein
VLAAGLIATAVAMAVVPTLSPIAGLLSRTIVTLGVYAGVLWTTGFLRPSERAFVSESLAGFVRR